MPPSMTVVPSGISGPTKNMRRHVGIKRQIKSKPASASAGWRRVSFDPELLAAADNSSNGEMSGMLILEEMDGAEFTSKVVNYDPHMIYGEDEQPQEQGQQQQQERQAKKRKTQDIRATDKDPHEVMSNKKRKKQVHYLIPELDVIHQDSKEETDETIDDQDSDIKVMTDADAPVDADGAADSDEGIEFDPADIEADDVDEEIRSSTLEAQRILQELNEADDESEDALDGDEIDRQDGDAEAVDVERDPDGAAICISSRPSASSWDIFGLHPLLVHALHTMKFSTPTPIQSAVLSVAISQYRDIIAAAATGSGKTLAFGLPIIHHILSDDHHAIPFTTQRNMTIKEDWSLTPLSAFILTPTRELALQITRHLKTVSQYTNLRIIPIVGGISTQKQERLLATYPHIIVATPGRLYELMVSGISSHLTDFDQLRYLVLDEADRMITNGHYPELEKIIQYIQKQRSKYHREQQPESEIDTDDERGANNNKKKKISKLASLQHFFFSATLTLPEQGRENMQRKVKKKNRSKKQHDDEADIEKQRLILHLQQICHLSRSPVILDLSASARLSTSGISSNDTDATSTTRHGLVSQLKETVIHCLDSDKDYHLYAYILAHPNQKMIIFMNAISCVRRVSSLLHILSLPHVYPLHAEMQQRQRIKNLERFTTATDSAYLICSDVAARGIDIPAVPIIIHYQLPRNTEIYIHRCGRTARAGLEGLSLAMINEHDSRTWSRITSMLHSSNAPNHSKMEKYQHLPSIMNMSRGRIKLARQIDAIQHQNVQQKQTKNWFQKQAAEMDIELDDEIIQRISKRKKNNKAYQYNDDAVIDDHDNHMNTNKNNTAQLLSLQQQLNGLLKQDINDTAQHRRFYTLNIVDMIKKQEEEQNRKKYQEATNKSKTKKNKKRSSSIGSTKPIRLGGPAEL